MIKGVIIFIGTEVWLKEVYVWNRTEIDFFYRPIHIPSECYFYYFQSKALQNKHPVWCYFCLFSIKTPSPRVLSLYPSLNHFVTCLSFWESPSKLLSVYSYIHHFALFGRFTIWKNTCPPTFLSECPSTIWGVPAPLLLMNDLHALLIKYVSKALILS